MSNQMDTDKLARQAIVEFEKYSDDVTLRDACWYIIDQLELSYSVWISYISNWSKEIQEHDEPLTISEMANIISHYRLWLFSQVINKANEY